MPNRFLDGTPAPNTPAPAQGANRFLSGSSTTPSPAAAPPASAPETSSGPGVGTVAGLGLGALVLGGLGLASRGTGIVPKMLKIAQTIRQQEMLSGLALPKSIVGNIGSAIEASAESGSLKPLREMLSMETVKDAATAYKNQAAVAPMAGVNLPGPTPGRIMGAVDTAAQKALVRAGIAPEEAETRMLQAPLGKNFGPMGEWMENGPMQYLFPFRRTPFNQLAEGGRSFGRLVDSSAPIGQRATTAGYMAAGAVHGAATSDDDAPLSLPIAISASGRQGLPYAVAALAGRAFGGAKTAGGVSGAALPVSEYGLDQSVRDPLRPFVHPAAFSALDKVFGGR
jgi:hypothetical protein